MASAALTLRIARRARKFSTEPILFGRAKVARKAAILPIA